MSEAERIWQRKTDDDLLEAAAELDTYTEEGQRIIRAELVRRGLEDPVTQAGELGTAAATPAEDADGCGGGCAAHGGSERSELECLRCDVPLRFAGAKRFHEGTRWGVMGELGHLFEKTEEFQVYVCPQCGHVELFVDVAAIDARP